MVDSVLEVKQIKQLSADGGATVVDVENQTIAVDSITDAAGTGAPDFPNGLSSNNIIEFIDTLSVTSTGATSSATAYTSTGLSISIADVSKYSKIFVIASFSYRAVKSTYNLQDYRLTRTAPSDSVLCFNKGIGSLNGDGNNIQRPSITLSGVDESLGSGAHTYQVQFRKYDGNSVYSGDITYLGQTGSIATITAWGIQ